MKRVQDLIKSSRSVIILMINFFLITGLHAQDLSNKFFIDVDSINYFDEQKNVLNQIKYEIENFDKNRFSNLFQEKNYENLDLKSLFDEFGDNGSLMLSNYLKLILKQKRAFRLFLHFKTFFLYYNCWFSFIFFFVFIF